MITQFAQSDVKVATNLKHFAYRNFSLGKGMIIAGGQKVTRPDT
jgi:hypothetical protein